MRFVKSSSKNRKPRVEDAVLYNKHIGAEVHYSLEGDDPEFYRIGELIELYKNDEHLMCIIEDKSDFADFGYVLLDFKNGRFNAGEVEVDYYVIKKQFANATLVM